MKHLCFDFKTYMFRFENIYALFLEYIGQGCGSRMVRKPNRTQISNRLLFSIEYNNVFRRRFHGFLRLIKIKHVLIRESVKFVPDN